MSTLAEIEAAAESLLLEQQEKLLASLQKRLARIRGSADESIATAMRRSGLHSGVWEVTEDFDAPLQMTSG